MTAAFSMGLPSISRRTETSILAVGGGALYLRPRRLGLWANAPRPRISMHRAKAAQTEIVGRRCMALIVTVGLDVRRGLWFTGDSTAGPRQACSATGGSTI